MLKSVAGAETTVKIYSVAVSETISGRCLKHMFLGVEEVKMFLYKCKLTI